jgi:four helix bundle protein
MTLLLPGTASFVMHNFRRLLVWQRARTLATALFELTARVRRPDEKITTTQMRRAALSIGAQIAEGCGKRTRAETIRYFDIACASAAETEHHLTMASDLGILPDRACAQLISEVVQIQRMLRALMHNLPDDP